MTDRKPTPDAAGSLTPALYVVATPLGNLGDITARALATLRGADWVACEDTRHSRKLLDHCGIRAQMLSLHEHNEAEAARRVIELLAEGKSVALISDAGTPGISDPGARAVAWVRQAGYPVVPLPGPNAAIAALSAAGLPDVHFLFYGFLPHRPTARRKEIEALQPLPYTLVFYEAPHRVVDTVTDLASLLEPERTLVVARELTKVFESIEVMPLGEGPAWLAADANRQRGEFVLIVAGARASQPRPADAERILKLLLAQLPLKQAVQLAAEISGEHRNALYQRALELKGSQ
jgi:16S rRNA (cytidine1402-2'-O)-methyltransferase